jgi:hypothetical protein
MYRSMKHHKYQTIKIHEENLIRQIKFTHKSSSQTTYIKIHKILTIGSRINEFTNSSQIGSHINKVHKVHTLGKFHKYMK